MIRESLLFALAFFWSEVLVLNGLLLAGCGSCLRTVDGARLLDAASRKFWRREVSRPNNGEELSGAIIAIGFCGC